MHYEIPSEAKARIWNSGRGNGIRSFRRRQADSACSSSGSVWNVRRNDAISRAGCCCHWNRCLLYTSVDRISINPQTFHDVTLERIGRCHSVADVYRAFETVRQVADFQINMDLIAGLPGESEAMFFESVDRMLELAPENATVHTLCVKRCLLYTSRCV